MHYIDMWVAGRWVNVAGPFTTLKEAKDRKAQMGPGRYRIRRLPK
jgi:hypothetical protein